MPNAECLVVVAIDPDDTLLNAFFGIEIKDFRIVFSDLSARKREDIIFDVCHILMPLQIVDAAFRVFQYDGKLQTTREREEVLSVLLLLQPKCISNFVI